MKEKIRRRSINKNLRKSIGRLNPASHAQKERYIWLRMLKVAVFVLISITFSKNDDFLWRTAQTKGPWKALFGYQLQRNSTNWQCKEDWSTSSWTWKRSPHHELSRKIKLNYLKGNLCQSVSSTVVLDSCSTSSSIQNPLIEFAHHWITSLISLQCELATPFEMKIRSKIEPQHTFPSQWPKMNSRQSPKREWPRSVLLFPWKHFGYARLGSKGS